VVQNQSFPHSYLFTLRIWAEEIGDNKQEWRGRVQHVPSGETQYFREWQSLVAHLQTMLSKNDLPAKNNQNKNI
jgi:hypothetical protein